MGFPGVPFFLSCLYFYIWKPGVEGFIFYLSTLTARIHMHGLYPAARPPTLHEEIAEQELTLSLFFNVTLACRVRVERAYNVQRATCNMQHVAKILLDLSTIDPLFIRKPPVITRVKFQYYCIPRVAGDRRCSWDQ